MVLCKGAGGEGGGGGGDIKELQGTCNGYSIQHNCTRSFWTSRIVLYASYFPSLFFQCTANPNTAVIL